ncbi:unnamed protein product [Paramecium sonneborni]|uniref:Transmembrane protein n=1 Tax=Paramecium sonneborni TaxID=65129 RepID=A0A8S1RBH6_9CILI|nr:unnamed protein product [Paramecium sonneborni]
MSSHELNSKYDIIIRRQLETKLLFPFFLIKFQNLDFYNGGWQLIMQVEHIGGLCEECDVDNIIGNGYYFKNQWDLICFSCFGIDNGTLPFLLALIQNQLILYYLKLQYLQLYNFDFEKYSKIQQIICIFKNWIKVQQYNIQIKSRYIYNYNQLSDHETILIKMFQNICGYSLSFSLLILIFSFNLPQLIQLVIVLTLWHTIQIVIHQIFGFIQYIYESF